LTTNCFLDAAFGENSRFGSLPRFSASYLSSSFSSSTVCTLKPDPIENPSPLSEGMLPFFMKLGPDPGILKLVLTGDLSFDLSSLPFGYALG
jgi:hypothetical protein